MVSLNDVIASIERSYELFKRYVAENEDYFNMSEIAEMLNETFKELQEITQLDDDADWNGDNDDDLT